MTAFEVTNLADLKAWAVGQKLIEPGEQPSPVILVWLHSEWKDRIKQETAHWCGEEVLSLG